MDEISGGKTGIATQTAHFDWHVCNARSENELLKREFLVLKTGRSPLVVCLRYGRSCLVKSRDDANDVKLLASFCAGELERLRKCIWCMLRMGSQENDAPKWLRVAVRLCEKEN